MPKTVMETVNEVFERVVIGTPSTAPEMVSPCCESSVRQEKCKLVCSKCGRVTEGCSE